MKIGDLVRCTRYSRLGVITRRPAALQESVCFQSQGSTEAGSIVEVFWTDMERTSWCDVASLEVINENR